MSDVRVGQIGSLSKIIWSYAQIIFSGLQRPGGLNKDPTNIFPNLLNYYTMESIMTVKILTSAWTGNNTKGGSIAVSLTSCLTGLD